MQPIFSSLLKVKVFFILSSLKVAGFSCALALLPAWSIAQETSPTRIEELTISATRQSRTIENIAGTVSIISIENIEKELVDDLDDLARFQPGVSMSTDARGGNQGFTIRGIGGNRVLNVVDGVRGSDIYFGNGKDSFEMDNLQSVQIIRGPASVLYGADAMGGAVIFTTKDARDYVGSDSGSYFGLRSSASDADEQIKGGATAAFQNGDFGLVAQFTQRNFEEHEVNGVGSVNPQDGDTQGILLKGFWDISDNQSLAISFESFVEERDFNLLSDLGRSVSKSLGFDEVDRERLGLEYQLERDSCLLYTSPSPRDLSTSRMPSSA